jgi:hypothetical protein
MPGFIPLVTHSPIDRLKSYNNGEARCSLMPVIPAVWEAKRRMAV